MVSTRSNRYGSDGHSESESTYQPLPTLSQRRQRWARLLRRQHYQPVIAEVLERELPKYAGSRGGLPTSLSAIMRECIHILASAPSIFAAAVDGTLAQRFLADAELQQEYATIQERAHMQPSIYLHLLADEYGVAPTANQYAVIREAVLEYLSSESKHQEMAWMVDNVTPPVVLRAASSLGYRKYLWTYRRSQKHVETLQRFCEGIAKRWTETPTSERDIPLTYPPGECGYSINSHVRLSQHRYRQSSNYVMNLVEDICSHLYRTGKFKQCFRMHQYIIYLIFRPEQGAIAEIFCSGLLQVWVDEGGGVNAYPAGRSVASARRVIEEQWVEHESWALEKTGLARNLRKQKERLEEDVLPLEMEMQEAWREALDSDDEGDGDDPKDLDYVPDDLVEELSKLGLGV